MAKYSLEFKFQVVQHYLREKAGYKNTAKSFGIDFSTVRKWVTRYQVYGESGLERKVVSRRHNAGLKLQVVLAVLEQGLSKKEVALKFGGIETSMVTSWIERYTENGLQGLMPKTTDRTPSMREKSFPTKKSDAEKTQEELFNELDYLRAENAYLTKLDALILRDKALRKNPSHRRVKAITSVENIASNT